ncbi:hypothetical protein [Marinobacter halophilus]|uniref:Uncharacterized protein n=1 Tax=Marinobacter halophilus TaxID=1323740 RepID=A0A2T1KEM6_9GAMM|nr:hypothetical protein [Marinobacter halophilus]PSF08565.1 hypothetical protein C7H08_07755 [Marinobacter halophilus]GGC61780.1 hypothetical protein GCM10011362_07770 [Marinobacter halophilus]
MFEKNKLLIAILAATLTVGLTACGGSSSNSGDQGGIDDPDKELDGNSDGTPAPGDDTTVAAGSETGRFVDSAVGGIEYVTSAGYMSITNDNGEFRFNEGETVTFRLGQLNFGTVQAGSLITPVELAGGDSEKSVNIARVLQTLDDDGIPDNGITITPATREKAAIQNPTDVATVNLDTAKEIILSLASDNTSAPIDVVTREKAESHLNETLAAEKPVTSCGVSTTPVTEVHLQNNTFGYIRLEEDDKEINLMSFGASDSLIEFHNDLGFVEKKTGTTWRVVTNGEVSFTDSDGTETFTACAVGPTEAPYYLIFNSDDGAVTLYSTKAYNATSASQSYLLTSIDSLLNELQHNIVTIDSELNAELISSLGFESASIAQSGALEVSDSTDNSTDALYLLAAQGKQIGIYLDFNGSETLVDVGIAAGIPVTTPVTTSSVAGNTFVARNEADNETIILVHRSDGTAFDYHNDAYQGSTQKAGVNVSTWEVNDETGELTYTETTESGEESTETFRVFESNTRVYAPDEEGASVETLSKTQAITEASFVGSFNVNVPTENTVDNALVINSDKTCSYDGTPCTWAIDASGKAELSFAGENVVTQIWQLATSNDEFAFVMTEPDLVSDIQPGFMTRN